MKHNMSSLIFFFFFATCMYLQGNLRGRLATQRNSLRKFNLQLLACWFEQSFTRNIIFIYRNWMQNFADDRGA